MRVGIMTEFPSDTVQSGPAIHTRFLKQAFTDFNLLVENYPQSVYRKDAQLHMIDIRNRLAQFEINVAEYYLRRRAYVAASRRAETVIERYQGSDSVPRALEIMEESYAKLGLADLERFVVLAPNSPFTKVLVPQLEEIRRQLGR